jgi:glycosyltransferase involved in cell wall biosynthesis
MRPGSETLPAISIVVPSLNQGSYLVSALDSLFQQDYPRLEVVVMDGGSSDGSVEIIRSYASRLRYWQSKADEGQGAAINEGIRRCSGDIVGWLNSDDYHVPDALWTLARAYIAWPHRGLYIGNGFRHRQDDGDLTPFCRRHIALSRDALVHGLDYVLQPSTFFWRDAWEAVGGLDPALRFCLDWDIVIRVAERYPAVLINEFLAVSREYPATKTSTGQMERIFEIQRMVKRHTGREVSLGTLHYLTEALLNLKDGSVPDQVREPLGSVQASLHQLFRRKFGNFDGFPETTDVQDCVHLPLAAVNGPRQPARDMRAAPRISIVVPSLNQAAFLGQALDSILGQGYPHVEIIACDAGSTDGSVEILQQYHDRLTYWVSEPDRGPAHAINKGFARATGEILGWLNSDDMLASDVLVAVGRAFAEDPELDMVYANALYVDEANRLYLADHGGYRTGLYYGEMQPRERIPAYWSYVHAVPQPTVFFRRRLLDSCGPVDERYHFIFDFELFFRFAAKAKIKKLERTHAFYRIHRAAKTSAWGEFLVELYRFSRQRWPDRRDPAFYPLWRDFLRGFARRHFGGRPRHWRQWAILALAGFCALAKVGNPERLMGWRKRPPLGPAAPNALASAPMAPSYAIRDRATRFRSTFCSIVLPKHPGLFGGEIRDFHLLRHLLKISTVEFFSVFPVASDDRTDWLGPFFEAVYAPDTVNPRLRSLLRRVLPRHFPVPGARCHGDCEELLDVIGPCRDALRQALIRQQPDFLFISSQINPIALTLDTSGLRSRLVMASYDVEAERIGSFAEASRGISRFAFRLESRRARVFEEQNLRAFDGVIAVSANDKDIFVNRYGLPAERVLVIENGVDPKYFTFAERRAMPTPHVVFVGTLNYLANRQAAWRLVRRIMPLVRKERPDACLWIVGQNPEPALLAENDARGTVVTGRVDDVRPYLTQASVTCMPLSAGAGTKLKILEALSAGVPIVCTPFAIKGLDVKDGEQLVVRESDEDLAAAIVTLIGQPEMATQLARHGRELVERQYTWDANLPRLDDWLQRLGSLPRRSHDRR